MGADGFGGESGQDMGILFWEWDRLLIGGENVAFVKERMTVWFGARKAANKFLQLEGF